MCDALGRYTSVRPLPFLRSSSSLFSSFSFKFSFFLFFSLLPLLLPPVSSDSQPQVQADRSYNSESYRLTAVPKDHCWDDSVMVTFLSERRGNISLTWKQQDICMTSLATFLRIFDNLQTPTVSVKHVCRIALWNSLATFGCLNLVLFSDFSRLSVSIYF